MNTQDLNTLHSPETENISTDAVWSLILNNDPESRAYLLQPEPGFIKINTYDNTVSIMHGAGKYEGKIHWNALHETYQHASSGKVFCATPVKEIAYYSLVNPSVYIEISPGNCMKLDHKNDVLLMSFDKESGSEELQIISLDTFYNDYDLSIAPHKDLGGIFSEFIQDFEALLSNEGPVDVIDEDLLHRIEGTLNVLLLHEEESQYFLRRDLLKLTEVLNAMKSKSSWIKEQAENGHTHGFLFIRTSLVTQSIIEKFIKLCSELANPDMTKSGTIMSMSRTASAKEQLEWAQSFVLDDKDSFRSTPHTYALKKFFTEQAEEMNRNLVPQLFFAGELITDDDIDFEHVISSGKKLFQEQFGEYPEDLLSNIFTKEMVLGNIRFAFVKSYSGAPIISQEDTEIPKEIEQLIDIWISYGFDSDCEFGFMSHDIMKRHLEDEHYSGIYSFYAGENNIIRKKVSDFLKIPYISSEDGARIIENGSANRLKKTSASLADAILGALTKSSDDNA